MHDIKYIRENADGFDAAMARRGLEGQSAAILALDEERRGVQTALQELQAKRNEESQRIGALKKAGEDAQEAMDAVAAIKAEMGALEERERTLAESLNQHVAALPNVMADDVPEGASEDDNVEVRVWNPDGFTPPLSPPEIGGEDSSVPEHFEIGEALGLMDFERAAKMSGSRFVLLSGGLARLERALAQFFLDTHVSEHGYMEVSPPLLVRDNALYGTGQLPKFEADLFECFGEFRRLKIQYDGTKQVDSHLQLANNLLREINQTLNEAMQKAIERKQDVSWIAPIFEGFADRFENHRVGFDGLRKTFSEFERLFKEMAQNDVGRNWLIPTSEVSLTNIVAEEIVDEDSLPRRYTAFTPCFRSEAGSAGKDTRGMIRQHQFYKVEMVGITKPEDSEAEQKRMVECAQAVLEKLELPYRTVVLCSGDTGFGARRTFDIEVWLPGQQRYREISSVSTCGDFQARRMNARTKLGEDKKTTFVHTLNGSGVAVGRALIAVMENYYDPSDGGVVVPEVLRPYMGGLEKIV